ncbi:MAG: tetraacyldisaccharide 4'-kinase [Hyphomicrobiaceae bacterium]
MREPAWWYERPHGVIARLLEPAAALWGGLVRRRFARATPYRAPLPVICIGNLTAGGAGKTPLALAVAELVSGMGLTSAFLSRGYGGRLSGPHWVDPERDRARDVGDEPLLLAAAHPTLICRDRAAGARAIAAGARGGRSADVIIMDDGLQNPGLAKDLSLAIVDGARGIGNGRVIPAGPLRAPLDFQFGLVDALVINGGSATGDGTGQSDFAARLRRDFDGPVLEARIVPGGAIDWLAPPVVAFAGIGVPDRFFATLAALGADPVARVAFPDHHDFTAADATRLLDLARPRGATLVTTEKDRARLAGGDGPLAELYAQTRALPIRLKLDVRDESRLTALIDGAVGRKVPRAR